MVDLVLGTRHERAAARLFGALVLLLAVVTALAVAANPPVDETAYIWLRVHAAAPAGPPVAGWWLLAVVEVSVLLLLGRSCRRYVAAVLLVVPTAPAAAWLAAAVLDRPGPFETADSVSGTFPTPATAVLGAVVVLAPVAVRVAVARRTRLLSTGNAWPEAVVVAAALLVALVHAWHLVSNGDAWPLDVLGGGLLGAGIAAGGWLWLETVPHGCPSCPWSEARPRPPDRVADHRWLYPLAVVWSLTAATALLVLAYRRGIPRLPESGVIGNGLELPLNLGMVVLLLVGTALAWRWHLTGAVLVGLAALVLGYAASVEYQPGISVLVLAATLPPAYLLWSRWHPTAPVRRVVVGSLAAALVLGGAVWASARTNAYYWGPAHPRSPLMPVDDPLVAWSWAGGVTSTSVTVTARTKDDAADVRLVLARDADLDDVEPTRSRASTAAGDHVVSWTVDSLRPSSRYHYAISVDGVLAGTRGTFRTFPVQASAFTFAVGADARTGSSGRVFDIVRAHDPLLFLNVGDFFYGDVDTDDPDRYVAQYDATLRAPAQAALYRKVPIAYTWGDHDFAANDADRHAPGRSAALDVYRRLVPHYPLPAGVEAPIFQAFTVGDVRFVLTDNRSQRDTRAAPPTMLGAAQFAMLTAELRDADRHSLLVWANADPWVDRAAVGEDTWGGFAQERRRVAEVLRRNEVDNLLMVSGDAHMLAYDDGSHTDYSRQGGTGFPLLHAAALDRKPSVKGGPYSGPVLPGTGQFGLVHVTPRGDGVRLRIEGVDWQDRVLFRRTVSLP
jgi:hypothetical protein